MSIRKTVSITRRFAVAALSVTSLFGAASAQAQNQDYPNRPIKLVVGFPPGGSSDVMARMVGTALSAKLGQPIVVDNKPGANTIIATEYVKSQPADGYTLLSSPSSFAISPAFKQGNYEFKDFAPVALIGVSPLLLVTQNEVPAKNVTELMSFVKTQQGKLPYASYGAGGAGHLATELLLSMTNAQMIHVPYKGGAAGLVDVIGGRVTMMMPTVTAGLTLAKDGKIKVIAVSGSKRIAAMPDVPTMAESGVPGYEVLVWEAIQAPAGTPPAIVARLNNALREVLATPDVREKLLRLGLEAETKMTPAELTAFIRSEGDKFAKIVNDRGIKVE